MRTRKIQKLIDEGKLVPFSEIYNAHSVEEKEEVQKRVEYYNALYKLREVREEKGFTQEDLSSLTGIPRTTISKIESGKRNLTFETLIQILSALSLKIEFVKV